MTFHTKLLFNYCAKVTITQDRGDTCRAYAAQVQSFLRDTFSLSLWPKDIMASLGPVVRGLTRMKDYVARWREGLSGSDLMVLKLTLMQWCRQGLKVQANEHHTWDERLVDSVMASFEFAYGETFRYGEATTPEGDDFNMVNRLTRKSVKVKASGNDSPDIMVCKAPGFKKTNKFSGMELTHQISQDEPINWPTAVSRMVSSDPIKKEDEESTPLFRDTRYCKHQRKDGTFAGGGKPLNPRFIRNVLRRIVKANRDWFGTRTPEQFGVHSFRIGAMNDYLDAGADYFEISSMGRWCSTSVLDYHRMKRETQHEWKRKALHHSLSNALRPGAEANIAKKTLELTKLMRSRAAAMATKIAAAPRHKKARQTTLTHWARMARAR